MQYVKVTNPTDEPLLLAGFYLFPSDSRWVHPALAQQAIEANPTLVLADAPSLAGESENTDTDETAGDSDETAAENAPELTALAALSKAELAALAEEKGIEVSGRATKSEIIELIEAAE